MQYRKKPVLITAEQFFQDEYDAMDVLPPGACACIMEQALVKIRWEDTPDGIKTHIQPRIHVHTLEGPLYVSHLDWIICGVAGEYYPCKPDIFEATYDPV